MPHHTAWPHRNAYSLDYIYCSLLPSELPAMNGLISDAGVTHR